jgi:IS5 family transposase
MFTIILRQPPTIIDAPPSTKNEAKARDPEMRQGKKNEREWHFGMKAHVGTDRRGIVHSLVTTSANVSDVSQMVHLLHGSEREVYGDQAYWSEGHRQAARARGIRYRIEEHRAALHHVRPGQFVSAQTTIDASAGDVSMLIAQLDEYRAKRST